MVCTLFALVLQQLYCTCHWLSSLLLSVVCVRGGGGGVCVSGWGGGVGSGCVWSKGAFVQRRLRTTGPPKHTHTVRMHTHTLQNGESSSHTNSRMYRIEAYLSPCHSLQWIREIPRHSVSSWRALNCILNIHTACHFLSLFDCHWDEWETSECELSSRRILSTRTAVISPSYYTSTTGPAVHLYLNPIWLWAGLLCWVVISLWCIFTQPVIALWSVVLFFWRRSLGVCGKDARSTTRPPPVRAGCRDTCSPTAETSPLR